MSDEIHVGDRFLVEVEVVEEEVSSTGYRQFRAVVPGFECHTPQRYTPAELLASKRLPRTIKVGDRVTHNDFFSPLTVEWGDDVFALARAVNGSLHLIRLSHLSHLTLADGETP